MKLKILKGEELFSEQGLHVLNDMGIAITASEDTECEISDEHFDRVKNILKERRFIFGLDENGQILQSETREEHINPVETDTPKEE